MEILPTPTLVKNAPTKNELLTSKKRTKTPEKVPIVYKTEDIKIKKEKATSKGKERRADEKKYQEKISELEGKIRAANAGIQDLSRIKTELGQCKTDIGELKTGKEKVRSDIGKANAGIQDISSIRTKLEALQEEVGTLKQRRKNIDNGSYGRSLHNELEHKIESSKREIESIEKGKLAQQIKNELLQSNPFLNEDNDQIDEFISAKVK